MRYVFAFLFLLIAGPAARAEAPFDAARATGDDFLKRCDRDATWCRSAIDDGAASANWGRQVVCVPSDRSLAMLVVELGEEMRRHPEWAAMPYKTAVEMTERNIWPCWH